MRQGVPAWVPRASRCEGAKTIFRVYMQYPVKGSPVSNTGNHQVRLFIGRKGYFLRFPHPFRALWRSWSRPTVTASPITLLPQKCSILTPDFDGCGAQWHLLRWNGCPTCKGAYTAFPSGKGLTFFSNLDRNTSKITAHPLLAIKIFKRKSSVT